MPFFDRSLTCPSCRDEAPSLKDSDGTHFEAHLVEFINIDFHMDSHTKCMGEVDIDFHTPTFRPGPEAAHGLVAGPAARASLRTGIGAPSY